MRRNVLVCLAVIGAALAGWIARRLLRDLEPFQVRGQSMAPAIPAGAMVALGPIPAELRRGMVVALRHPDDPGLELIKRVAGLPGDLIGGPDGEVRLPAGRYLVLGDNAAASTDGRAFGPVGGDALLGEVRFVYWPPRAWGRPGRSSATQRPSPGGSRRARPGRPGRIR